MQRSDLIHRIQQFKPDEFDRLALNVFNYQSTYNPLYKRYLELLKKDKKTVQQLADIPFLPIQLFKNHIIKTGDWRAEVVYTSSGTTGQTSSKHQVYNKAFYLNNAVRCFQSRYGDIGDYCVLALLPAYLERKGSSLVDMIHHFIQVSTHSDSGFFLYNTEDLLPILYKNQKEEVPTILIGVSFALLDLAEQVKADFSNIVVMETGGMKGRKKEITRQELHEQLCSAFGVPSIHSEYGMTELLSQAYSLGKGIFQPSATMKVLARDISDPFDYVRSGRTGGLNIIDLANIDSCAFIATDDLGKVYSDGSFEVLGRFDNSDVRGCNLMIE